LVRHRRGDINKRPRGLRLVLAVLGGGAEVIASGVYGRAPVSLYFDRSKAADEPLDPGHYRIVGVNEKKSSPAAHCTLCGSRVRNSISGVGAKAFEACTGASDRVTACCSWLLWRCWRASWSARIDPHAFFRPGVALAVATRRLPPSTGSSRLDWRRSAALRVDFAFGAADCDFGAGSLSCTRERFSAAIKSTTGPSASPRSDQGVLISVAERAGST